MNDMTETSPPDPKVVFGTILSKMKAPPLVHGLSVSEVRELFASVVVRDTLLELGVSLTRAEELAGNQGGCPRIRFNKCVEILGLQVDRQ